jgi:hypothetical protein
MKEQVIREPARVLFHLNGYTKVQLERTGGIGTADGGIVWEISTDLIPGHLRNIGSRFIVQYKPLAPVEMNDVDAIRGAKDRVKILDLNGE